ncbi:MAG: hypothetical protein JOZ14_02350 [Acidobacteria bacterium]|nr:hypothetical protein [Acidobacteriota bacterium]
MQKNINGCIEAMVETTPTISTRDHDYEAKERFNWPQAMGGGKLWMPSSDDLI